MHSNRREEGDGGYAMLMSIIALLFALGDDAEHAAGLAYAERYRLLWILRPAEVVARNLALEAAWSPDLCDLPPPALLNDDSPAEAQRLGGLFRAVALMLGMLAAQTVQRDSTVPETGQDHLRQMRDVLVGRCPALRRAGIWLDTS